MRAQVIKKSRPTERKWVVAPSTQGLCVRRRLLGCATSIVEGVGDEFISMKENFISCEGKPHLVS